jgi:CRP/FNR family cyclic AMP-dependent transcriptional regulator
MTPSKQHAFDLKAFLASAGIGRTVISLKAKQTFFQHGNVADSVFYLQKGSGKLMVLSPRGKEATVTLLASGDFIGVESMGEEGGLRLATAMATTACVALKIERATMCQVMHEEHALSDLFLEFLLARVMRIREDLLDQLFNSTEKRLARTLLLMAEYGQPGKPEPLIPKISQETLAQMIGTTRSRVSFFMNRFRELGFIEYKGCIHVNKSLLDVLLNDRLPDQNASHPSTPKVPQ